MAMDEEYFYYRRIYKHIRLARKFSRKGCKIGRRRHMAEAREWREELISYIRGLTE